MPERKPHILMLINDEHRPDVMPIEGDPHIRTPTLDWMIDGGFYFRNAYTPSPICVPARQSLPFRPLPAELRMRELRGFHAERGA